jgi:hypothetical protein
MLGSRQQALGLTALSKPSHGILALKLGVAGEKPARRRPRIDPARLHKRSMRAGQARPIGSRRTGKLPRGKARATSSRDDDQPLRLRQRAHALLGNTKRRHHIARLPDLPQPLRPGLLSSRQSRRPAHRAGIRQGITKQRAQLLGKSIARDPERILKSASGKLDPQLRDLSLELAQLRRDIPDARTHTRLPVAWHDPKIALCVNRDNSQAWAVALADSR